MRFLPLLVCIPALFLVGCATTESLQASDGPWRRYQDFEAELVQKGTSADFGRFVSARLMRMLDDAASEQERAEFRASGAFPLWLAEERSNFVKRLDSGHFCLSVNGLTQGGGHGAVFVEYLPEGGVLKADAIHYQYFDSPSQYVTEAKCPSEVELSFATPE